MKLDHTFTSASREDYESAVRELTDGLASISQGRIHGILLYGSVARGDYSPGRSDVDIFASLNSGIRTDSDFLLETGRVLKHVTERRRVEIEFGVYDLDTMQDGRFFPFGKGFAEHLRITGKVVYGNDPRTAMKCYDWKHAAEDHVGFGLRAMRKNLVEAPYYMGNNSLLFFNGCVKSAEKAAHMPREVADYVGGRQSDSDLELARNTGFLDLLFLEELHSVLKNGWRDVFSNSEKALELQKRCVVFYENGVARLLQVPRPPIRE